MADKNVVKHVKADRRRRRVRSQVFGTTDRPRLTVAKSLKNTVAQIVDDENRVTLVGLSSYSKGLLKALKADDSKTAVARKLGEKLAELAREKGVEEVVFDRNQYRFHGRVKAVAEGARKGGLKF